MNNSIIVIDDEQDFLESVRRGLITSGFKKVTTFQDPREAASVFGDGKIFDVALIDITMPGLNGIELLEVIKSNSPRTECIMVTAINEARSAVNSLRKGAYDYVVKPISKEDLISAVNRALERKRLVDILDLSKSTHTPKLEKPEAFEAIATQSDKVIRILKEAELHAVSNVPILITGDTGTGKELLSRAIHAASLRSKFPFTPINMDGMTSQLFDAEFFGHTKGAFTGADNDRMGYLEHTNKGTLFLDEIGHLPIEMQGKLLRVLQDGEFIKLGTSTVRKTDVRFIAATNNDLELMMNKKQFRRDLYYRLRGGWLHLPPLRERQEDIPLLINTFVKEFQGSRGVDFEEKAMSSLLNYNYPGNIRELKSIVQSAVNLAHDMPISIKHLPAQLKKVKIIPVSGDQSGKESFVSLTDVEKNHILKVYQHMNRNKSQTARVLSIGLNTLRRKLESYGEE